MPVRSGQLLPVASDQAVGFVSLPATAFSVRAGLRAFLSSCSQITANEVSRGTEHTALPPLPVGKKYRLAPCCILPFSLAVDLPFSPS